MDASIVDVVLGEGSVTAPTKNAGQTVISPQRPPPVESGPVEFVIQIQG